MAGIDRTSGHVGMSSASAASNTMKAAGGVAFNLALAGGTAAASALGGPAGNALASSASSALRSGLSAATGGGGGALGGVNAEVQAGVEKTNAQTGDVISQSQVRQEELFALQMAMNAQSQSFNTLTNVQKAKHDAAMAAIQNTR